MTIVRGSSHGIPFPRCPTRPTFNRSSSSTRRTPLTPLFSKNRDGTRFIHGSSSNGCTNDVIYLTALKRLHGLNPRILESSNPWILFALEISVFVRLRVNTRTVQRTPCNQQRNCSCWYGTFVRSRLTFHDYRIIYSSLHFIRNAAKTRWSSVSKRSNANSS